MKFENVNKWNRSLISFIMNNESNIVDIFQSMIDSDIDLNFSKSYYNMRNLKEK